jgi:hypothetical protein
MSEPEKVTADSLFIPGGRRGGRPRAKEAGSRISVWLPVSAHDRLIKLANEQEQSISACVRALLSVKLR